MDGKVAVAAMNGGNAEFELLPGNDEFIVPLQKFR